MKNNNNSNKKNNLNIKMPINGVVTKITKEILLENFLKNINNKETLMKMIFKLLIWDMVNMKDRFMTML